MKIAGVHHEFPEADGSWSFIQPKGKVTIQATFTAAGKQNPFVDVTEGMYCYDAVLWAFNAVPQITNGIDATHFGPDNTVKRGEARFRVAVIPTQATDHGGIRFAVSIDGGEKRVFSLSEPFRSERWKTQVLRGQAVRELTQYVGMGTHTLVIEALDDHIIVDQWLLDYNLKRQHYRFPL